jgi:hypothetical protein
MQQANHRRGSWSRRLVGLALAAALGTLASGAAAQTCGAKNHQYYVDVTNTTGYTIYYLYVSHGSEKNWGPDVLGQDVLMSGTTQRVYLCNFPSPMFDIRAEDEDGDTYTFFQIDVSRRDLTINLSDID